MKIYIVLFVVSVMCGILFSIQSRELRFNKKMSLQSALNIEFTTLKQIKSSPWFKYLTCMYSDAQLKEKIQVGGGVFKMNDLWILEKTLIPDIYSYGTINKLPLTTSPYLSLFTNLDIHAEGANKIFIYHYHTIPGNDKWGNADPDPKFDLLKGISSNTWAEVIHSADRMNGFKWFYYMPGSGNWMNLGKTKIFADHGEALKLADLTSDVDDQTQMAQYFLSDAGGNYDTLQFTSRSEYQFKYEILDLRLNQKIKENPCVKNIKTRDDRDCICDQTRSMLNCEINKCGLKFI